MFLVCLLIVQTTQPTPTGQVREFFSDRFELVSHIEVTTIDGAERVAMIAGKQLFFLSPKDGKLIQKIGLECTSVYPRREVDRIINRGGGFSEVCVMDRKGHSIWKAPGAWLSASRTGPEFHYVFVQKGGRSTSILDPQFNPVKKLETKGSIGRAEYVRLRDGDSIIADQHLVERSDNGFTNSYSMRVFSADGEFKRDLEVPHRQGFTFCHANAGDCDWIVTCAGSQLVCFDDSLSEKLRYDVIQDLPAVFGITAAITKSQENGKVLWMLASGSAASRVSFLYGFSEKGELVRKMRLGAGRGLASVSDSSTGQTFLLVGDDHSRLVRVDVPE